MKNVKKWKIQNRCLDKREKINKKSQKCKKVKNGNWENVKSEKCKNQKRKDKKKRKALEEDQGSNEKRRKRKRKVSENKYQLAGKKAELRKGNKELSP